jgi:DNA-binding response OmpR family regulator
MSAKLRVLIVEDERLLAMQLEDDISEAGHEVVGSAMSSNEALQLANETQPDLALLDIHLADGPTAGVDIARRLADHCGLVVFMTSNAKRIPGDFAGAVGVINKPLSTQGLTQTLRFIRGRMVNDNRHRPPSALTLSPEWQERWGSQA